MLVRIVRDWETPDLMRQTSRSSGLWEGVQFTEEPVTECDYLICLNPPKTALNVRAKSAWLFTQEPPVEFYQWHTAAFPYFDRVYTQHDVKADNIVHEHCSLPWHIGKSYDELIKLKPQKDKLNRVSTVTSNAYTRPGHIARFDLIQYLKEEDFGLELFGRGIRFVEDKYDGIAPFTFSIAIENSFIPYYWTEKLVDCLLSWTMPVYAGCPNILDYFSEDALLIIEPFDKPASMARLQEAIEAERWKNNLEAIHEARQLILNKYQFFPAMVEKIKTFEAENPTIGKRQYKIPKVPRPKYGTLQERAINRIKKIIGR